MAGRDPYLALLGLFLAGLALALMGILHPSMNYGLEMFIQGFPPPVVTQMKMVDISQVLKFPPLFIVSLIISRCISCIKLSLFCFFCRLRSRG
jgi:hypothetical protein